MKGLIVAICVLLAVWAGFGWLGRKLSDRQDKDE